MCDAWVYLMTSRPFGPLYVGVTNDIARRALEHREGRGSSFTTRYRLTRLVYLERHDDIVVAIRREKAMKHWPRAWKLNLIEGLNPHWEDLFLSLNA